MAKKPKDVPENHREAAPGSRSVALDEYKEKMGLPRWEDLSKQLEELAKRHDVPWAQEVQARVEIHKKYVEYQSLLVQLMGGAGLQHLNAFHNAVDLQTKLFELEEQLRAEGKNPLLDEKWVKAREMLAKEMQFLHKHKLDIADFQSKVESRKRRYDDDSLFVVETDKDDEPGRTE